MSTGCRGFNCCNRASGRKGGLEALRGKGQILYFVFDLLYVDGYDLTSCSVVERKAKLAEILRPSTFIKLSEHIEGEGEAFFREIENFHLEGMIAKRANSKYVQKRTSDWLKVKTIMRSGSRHRRLHSTARHPLSFWIPGLRTISRRRAALRRACRRRFQRTNAGFQFQTDAAAESRIAVRLWRCRKPTSRFNG